MKKFFNILGFQICWWVCVLFSTTRYSYIGAMIMLLYIGFHLLYISDNFKNELKLILITGLIGTIFDSLFIVFNIFNYSSSFSFISFIVPLWITAMWAGFATTLNHSLYWINKNYFIAFLMGFIFGPISYFTGQSFNAIQFNIITSYGLVILAFSWGIAVPLVVYINHKVVINK